MTLRLRWETALPVRLAELKVRQVAPPTQEGDGYRIGVYGIPNGNFKGDPKRLGDPLKEYAVLRRDGKKDVHPVRVEVFQWNDGSAVVYLFPLSAEITRTDEHLEFAAHIGRIVVAQNFTLADMDVPGQTGTLTLRNGVTWQHHATLPGIRMCKFRVPQFWLFPVSGVLLIAADPSWKIKPASQWSEEDARQSLPSLLGLERF